MLCCCLLFVVSCVSLVGLGVVCCALFDGWCLLCDCGSLFVVLFVVVR